MVISGGKKFFNYGIPRSDECRKKISERRKQYLANLTIEERDILAQRSRESGIKGAEKIGKKAKERLSDPEFYQKHVETHNTQEYRENLSIKITEAFQRDDVKERHLQSVNTNEYKQLQRELTKNRWEKEGYRDKVSNSLKQTLSSAEHRKKMSEKSKESTTKRLETRRLNKLKKEIRNEHQIFQGLYQRED